MRQDWKPLEKQVAGWLAEDVGAGDITSSSTIPEGAHAQALIRSKQALVVCGLPVAREVFRQVDSSVRFVAKAKDGQAIEAQTVLAEVRGSARSLLTAERTALNILQRLSGVATLTSRFAREVQGTRAKILDTRKTTPGLRILEKYAVKTGGGANHRMGLFDMVLVKDNHIEAASSITAAVKMVAAKGISLRKVQVEVTDLKQLREALAAGAGLILLDNMSLSTMRKAVTITAGKALLEASGNVNLKRVGAIARTGVDRISVGALTHSAPAADIHMMIEEARR